jgi:glucose/arabinose dehydrogenase
MNGKNLAALVLVLSSVVILGISPLPGRSQSVPSLSNEPTIADPNSNLAIEKYVGGLEFPSGMAFLGPDDILVLEKNSGQVRRVVNSTVLEEPVLDVSVATKDERGLLGIAVSKDSQNNATFVFLYYTESSRDSDDDLDGINPLGNRLYRYEFVNGKLVNGKLLLDLPAKEASHHNGGRLAIGPDGTVYLAVGDLQDPNNTQSSHDHAESRQ